MPTDPDTGLKIGYRDRQRGVSRKTSRHEVVYGDGRKRVKLLTDSSAERLRDTGLQVRRLEDVR